MIKWTKLPTYEGCTHDPNLVYIVPCDEGSQIWLDGEMGLVEGVTVLDIVDKFNAIGCTSFKLALLKEDIKAIVEQFEKEK